MKRLKTHQESLGQRKKTPEEIEEGREKLKKQLELIELSSKTKYNLIWLKNQMDLMEDEEKRRKK